MCQSPSIAAPRGQASARARPTPSTSGSRAGCASGARTCWSATAATRAGCTRSGRRSASPAAATRPGAVRRALSGPYRPHRLRPAPAHPPRRPAELQPGPVRRPEIASTRLENPRGCREQTRNFRSTAVAESRHVLSTFPPPVRASRRGRPAPPSLPRQRPAMRTYLITYDLATPARHTPVERHHAAGRGLGPPAGDHLVRAIHRAPRRARAPPQAPSRRRGRPADPAGRDRRRCCSTRRCAGSASAARRAARTPAMSLRSQ